MVLEILAISIFFHKYNPFYSMSVKKQTKYFIFFEVPTHMFHFLKYVPLVKKKKKGKRKTKLNICDLLAKLSLSGTLFFLSSYLIFHVAGIAPLWQLNGFVFRSNKAQGVLLTNYWDGTPGLKSDSLRSHRGGFISRKVELLFAICSQHCRSQALKISTMAVDSWADNWQQPNLEILGKAMVEWEWHQLLRLRTVFWMGYM